MKGISQVYMQRLKANDAVLLFCKNTTVVIFWKGFHYSFSFNTIVCFIEYVSQRNSVCL